MPTVRIDEDVHKLLIEIQLNLVKIRGKRTPLTDIIRLALHVLKFLEREVGTDLYLADLSNPQSIETHLEHIILKKLKERLCS